MMVQIFRTRQFTGSIFLVGGEYMVLILRTRKYRGSISLAGGEYMDDILVARGRGAACPPPPGRQYSLRVEEVVV